MPRASRSSSPSMALLNCDLTQAGLGIVDLYPDGNRLLSTLHNEFKLAPPVGSAVPSSASSSPRSSASALDLESLFSLDVLDEVSREKSGVGEPLTFKGAPLGGSVASFRFPDGKRWRGHICDRHAGKILVQWRDHGSKAEGISGPPPPRAGHGEWLTASCFGHCQAILAWREAKPMNPKTVVELPALYEEENPEFSEDEDVYLSRSTNAKAGSGVERTAPAEINLGMAAHREKIHPHSCPGSCSPRRSSSRYFSNGSRPSATRQDTRCTGQYR